jgi:hypothetical protein
MIMQIRGGATPPAAYWRSHPKATVPSQLACHTNITCTACPLTARGGHQEPQTQQTRLEPVLGSAITSLLEIPLDHGVAPRSRDSRADDVSAAIGDVEAPRKRHVGDPVHFLECRGQGHDEAVRLEQHARGHEGDGADVGPAKETEDGERVEDVRNELAAPFGLEDLVRDRRVVRLGEEEEGEEDGDDGAADEEVLRRSPCEL